MDTTFFSRLEDRCRRINSVLCVGLDPRVEARDSQEAYEKILSANDRILQATLPYTVCDKPNIAFYEAWGSGGLLALEETLRRIPEEVPVLVDAKRGDIGATAEAYAQALVDRLGADGVTLAPYMGRDTAEAFLRRPGTGVFILCRTSNPGAGELQDLRVETASGTAPGGEAPGEAPGEPLYLQTADRALAWSSRVGLVAAGNDAEALGRLRRRHPEAWFLSPGIGAQGGTMEEAVAAGIRKDGLGILAVVARGIAGAEDPGAKAAELTRELNAAREKALGGGNPEKPALPADRRRLFQGLLDTGSFQTGRFTLKSGKISPFYIDMRRAGAEPRLLKQLGRAYAQLIRQLPGGNPDRIAGIPVAALPLAAAASLETGIPMIYPRMQQKKHGTGNRIEGDWEPGQRVLLLDDLITTGKSKLEAAEILRESGLIVEDLAVILERGRQGRRDMEGADIRLHAWAQVEELFDFCRDLGVIGQGEYQAMRDFAAEEA